MLGTTNIKFINLCSRWPCYKQPRLRSSLTWLPTSNRHGHYEHFFITLFWSWGWRFACVRLLPFAACYVMRTSCFPMPFRDQLNRLYFPFIICSQVFWLKDLWSKPFLPFTKNFLNGRLQWNFWRMTSNWGMSVVLLDWQMRQKCSPAVFILKCSSLVMAIG